METVQSVADGALLPPRLSDFTSTTKQHAALPLQVASHRALLARWSSHSLPHPLSHLTPCRFLPEVDGLELSIVKVSTTDGNGVASITFSAEEMNVIKNSGIMVSSVTFRIVVDGAFADSVKVRCPIGA